MKRPKAEGGPSGASSSAPAQSGGVASNPIDVEAEARAARRREEEKTEQLRRQQQQRREEKQRQEEQERQKAQQRKQEQERKVEVRKWRKVEEALQMQRQREHAKRVSEEERAAREARLSKRPRADSETEPPAASQAAGSAAAAPQRRATAGPRLPAHGMSAAQVSELIAAWQQVKELARVTRAEKRLHVHGWVVVGQPRRTGQEVDCYIHDPRIAAALGVPVEDLPRSRHYR